MEMGKQMDGNALYITCDRLISVVDMSIHPCAGYASTDGFLLREW